MLIQKELRLSKSVERRFANLSDSELSEKFSQARSGLILGALGLPSALFLLGQAIYNSMDPNYYAQYTQGIWTEGYVAGMALIGSPAILDFSIRDLFSVNTERTIRSSIAKGELLPVSSTLIGPPQIGQGTTRAIVFNGISSAPKGMRR